MNSSNLKNIIEESYKSLILKLKSQAVDSDTFIRIKNKFLQEIDSPRRIYHTESMADLIYVLERGLIISCHNIHPIFKISKEIDGRIKEETIKHVKLITDYNYYSEPYIYKNCFVENEKPFTSDHTIPFDVIELVSKCIGRFWKELAFELGFKEGEIDEFDNNSDSDNRKSEKMLTAFNARGQGHSEKRIVLISALTNMRRNRLKTEVEQKFMQSCSNCRLPSIY